MLDKESVLPLYTQIENYLQAEIRAGKYKDGDLVPSERELSETFQISRMTVRQAINNLVAGGILYRKRGKGTYVSAPKMTYPLKGVFSFTEDMERKGVRPSTRVISYEQVTDAHVHVYEQLEMKTGSVLICLKRVRLADGEPVAVETAYLPHDWFVHFQKHEGSIYGYVRHTLKKEIHRAKQHIEASLAGDEGALLGISAECPVLVVQRTTYFESGEPFECVQTIFRGDQYSFRIEMEQEKGENDVFFRD